MGNGASERVWKTVGEVDGGQRCNLSSETLTKLSILRGQATMEHHHALVEGGGMNNLFEWANDDTEIDMQLEKFGVRQTPTDEQPPDFFCAFVEKFERGLVHK